MESKEPYKNLLLPLPSDEPEALRIRSKAQDGVQESNPITHDVERYESAQRPSTDHEDSGWVELNDDHGYVVFCASSDYQSHLADSDDWWSRLSEEDYRQLTEPPARPARCTCCGGIYRHSPLCKELHDFWSITLPLGKYMGRQIAQVAKSDPDYLRWLYLESDSLLRSDVRQEIVRVLDRTRFAIPPLEQEGPKT